MGFMQFSVHPPDLLSPQRLERVYFAGQDQVPWLARIRSAGEGIVVEREGRESGNLRVPWVVDGAGELMLSTASLMDRMEPYHLAVELARGYLNQVRNTLAEWQSIGLTTPAGVNSALRAAMNEFGVAATSQRDRSLAAEHAQRAMEWTYVASRQLSAAYAEQALAARHRQVGKLDTWLGCGLGDEVPRGDAARQFCDAFQVAMLPLGWPQIESLEGKSDWALADSQLDWCKAEGLRAVCGPLLQLDRLGIPDWLYLWSGDITSLGSFVAEHVRRTVQRYQGRVFAWQAVSRLHGESPLRLSEEDTVRLAVTAIETLREVDDTTPVWVSFDQPWAEHMARRELDLSPWHLADALMRSELGITGIVLELNVGYFPNGTSMRDTIELGRQMDLWSQLGLPLFIECAVPSSLAPDPLARSGAQVIPQVFHGDYTPATQQHWVEETAAFLVSKPYVRGVIWKQFFDAMPHDLPNAGLLDASGMAKPALATLASLRRAHLH